MPNTPAPPTCCKRPMSRHNGQFVCRKCRASFDAFTASTAARTGDQ